ncbi:pyridoxamine 5'-phosphate oxidase family protein [Desulforhopalus vacuolatus]|uniref:pyridoxamine 5'-phosphate oxidase family protein n=1 Tax=Desulforhopalus vacuolatus TaxID=40414 RepID=UPI00196235C4|nr:pyridoxamine 5'-phosphate oxidase family protein [Desulforhopalus vacuolatus]MBM9520906.1 pyridoxamine 5'-phosphate oxidase family protein [Desulforhopalus vacuolatus]
MNLHDYFNGKKGFGVISTSNKQGEVNSAVYAKPHVIDKKTIAFIMRDRLTRKNVTENPQAHYMFIESDKGFHGIRLSLTLLEETQDQERIEALSRRSPADDGDDTDRFLVTFTVTRALTLVGGEEALL